MLGHAISFGFGTPIALGKASRGRRVAASVSNRGKKHMKLHPQGLRAFPRQCAVIALASAIGLPVWAQQAPPAGNPQSTPPTAAQEQQPSPEAQSSLSAPKEGFWGHVNPFARKKWVQKRLDPINDRLTELDQVNAKNARDIKDVDARAQAGIQQAQSSADKANQTATAAGSEAQAICSRTPGDKGSEGHSEEFKEEGELRLRRSGVEAAEQKRAGAEPVPGLAGQVKRVAHAA